MKTTKTTFCRLNCGRKATFLIAPPAPRNGEAVDEARYTAACGTHLSKAVQLTLAKAEAVWLKQEGSLDGFPGVRIKMAS